MKKYLKPKFLLVFALLVVLLVIGYRGLSPKEQKYLSATVTARDMIAYTAYSGSVSLVNDITQTAKQQIQVKELYVKKGDTISAGDTILMTKDGQRIKAETQGTLTEWFVSADDTVPNGGRLARIADYRNLKGTFEIDEMQVSSLSSGQTMDLYVQATGQELQGIVTHIHEDPSIDGGVAYYTVDLGISDTSKLKNGMSLEVRIIKAHEKEALVLPVYALTMEGDGKTYVFRRTGNTYQKQEVTLGITDGIFAQVKGSVSLGDVFYYKQAEQAVKGVMKTLLGR